ncbi:uncharacterized protein LOC113273038 [Papaver somniferum]|uniref:uncharacterized protein LOC113273038 n=1 Tax=Papaver somniferum TaxID=3469 RepID=UPI000E6F84FB|nr:uncharacterized protein LOC113273038 [Papaver somniferum]
MTSINSKASRQTDIAEGIRGEENMGIVEIVFSGETQLGMFHLSSWDPLMWNLITSTELLVRWFLVRVLEHYSVEPNKRRDTNNHDSTDDNTSDNGEHYESYEPGNAEVAAKNVVSQPRPSTTGASTSTTSTSRVTNENLASNLNLRRSPRLMGHAQSRHAQNAISNPQGVQVGRGRGRPLQSVAGRSSFLNCARGITYKVGFKKLHLPPPSTCPKCQAMIFYREPKGFCCSDGEVILPFVSPPIELLEMYEDQTEVGEHFRRYIRRYNQCFSLTSIWVNYDRELADNREGVYTFRVQGDIYHKIGSLLPPVVENETDPPRTVRPRYIHMYIYDTDNEINWRMEEGGADLNREVMEKLRTILDTHNRFMHVIRPLAKREDIQRCRLVIKEQPATKKQYTLPTASQVAAIVVEGDGLDQNSMDENGRQFTCLEYYSHMLQIRSHDASLLLRGGRLLQQYVVDNWVKIDSSRLRWLSNHQEKIRAELHQGIQDARMEGETSAKNFGQRKVLPSSYMARPPDMYHRYQDAMTLVQKYGKPDLFITMNFNPLWDEIVSNLRPGQSASDIPDLTTRVFRANLEDLKEDLFTKLIFGRIASHVHVVEFQKMGLPHVHMLIILRDEDKLQGPDDYEKIVREEILDPEEEPELHECVKKWMIHGTCGSKCMRDGKCKRNFPKEFSECTVQGKDAYPVYRRRNDGRRVDNRMSVPYNPWLLHKYDCHINVEICSIVESIKYLYKYVYKGPDYVSFGVQPVDHDEITRYINARWVCAQEAIWNIFIFPLYKDYPSVVRLQIHLPNQQSLRGPISFDDLLLVDVERCRTFKRAAEKLGLLENDQSAKASLAEVATVKMSSALGRQFASILNFWNPSGSLIQEELSIPISDEDLSSVQKLNKEQYRADDIIMGSIERKESKVFFIDGPGGTGKTYLYRAILATVRKNGGIALATTTSGIAATMLPDGRTTHSRFQLPMTPTSTSTCLTKKQTEEAKLLRHATVLMWDEATMEHRYSLEAFDRKMRDITGVAEPFGEKILIMGGDFRQRIIRNDIELHYILNRSHLWENVHVLHLKKNMRAAEDASYYEFLIRVGDGDKPCVANEMIKVPEDMVIPWVSDASLS